MPFTCNPKLKEAKQLITLICRDMMSDKELYEKLECDKEKFMYTKIPSNVKRILRPSYKKDGKEYVMLALIVKNKYENTLLVNYLSYNGYSCDRGAGMATSMYDGKFDWISLAENIAETWPETAVKHRTKKTK